ncbi:hypothetical protein [Aquimarina hainanensis]|uniref:hypothetical protein n=1 Tax=Aquimarina hainanensis TaxID=1578017 RepID=UPI003621FA57
MIEQKQNLLFLKKSSFLFVSTGISYSIAGELKANPCDILKYIINFEASLKAVN